MGMITSLSRLARPRKLPRWLSLLWSSQGNIAISYRKPDGTEGIRAMTDEDEDLILELVNAALPSPAAEKDEAKP